jgi:hypothetical protein
MASDPGFASNAFLLLTLSAETWIAPIVRLFVERRIVGVNIATTVTATATGCVPGLSFA